MGYSYKPPIEHCKSCGAPIYWATSEASGKRHPVDVEPVEDGNVLLSLRGGTGLVARVLKKGEEVEDGRNRYTSHFATCPQSKTWRKKR